MSAKDRRVKSESLTSSKEDWLAVIIAFIIIAVLSMGTFSSIKF